MARKPVPDLNIQNAVSCTFTSYTTGEGTLYEWHIRDYIENVNAEIVLILTVLIILIYLHSG